MEPLLLVIALSTIVEVIIEAFMPLLDPLFKRLPVPEDVEPYLYLSMAVGLVLTLAYQADLLAAIGLAEEPALAGIVITGFFIGRGANFTHSVIKLVAR